MLVDDDGLTILRRLRKKELYYPVIMMSANGHTVERVVGLEVGADDYLLKPVDLRELLARIRAVLRRCELSEFQPRNEYCYQFGDYCLNQEKRQLFCGKKEIPLTNIEYNLLLTLVQHPNQVRSRDDLLNILKYGQDTLSRSIDVHIRHLRCKIEPNPSEPIYIRTSRGRGYVFYDKPNANTETQNPDEFI
jgi:DNA-binding response OmpR family regulator